MAGSGKVEREVRCPVASALELLGDRWTLVVVRDLVVGKHRYGEFQESPEGIPTNILAERLKRLENLEIVEKRPYQERPPRFEYHLTERGEELRPVLAALRAWGLKHIEGTAIPEHLHHLLPPGSATGGGGRRKAY
jgi:DNA-binding HxlR family transcriptional regulator